MVKDSCFLKALRDENEGRVPVWLMRQAGRYMPSYQKIRKKYPLYEMFHHEQLITEITLLPVDELDVDAAIVFSDILLPLQSLGYSLSYDTGGPPQVFASSEKIPCSYESVKDRFLFLSKAIKQLKSTLKIPLIGFSGAPFTLASYILDKENHALLKKTKNLLYQDRTAFHKLLNELTEPVIHFLRLQIESGVDAIQIFDSWSGVLDEMQFKECSLFYIQKIVDALQDTHIPILVFCRGSCLYAEEIASLNVQGISLDWQSPLNKMKMRIRKPIAIQGNLDPDILKAPFPYIKQEVEKALLAMQGEKRFIMNLGHGIQPDTPYDAVSYFVNLVKEFTS